MNNHWVLQLFVMGIIIPDSTKLRKGDIVVPFVRPFTLNNLESFDLLYDLYDFMDGNQHRTYCPTKPSSRRGHLELRVHIFHRLHWYLCLRVVNMH